MSDKDKAKTKSKTKEKDFSKLEKNLGVVFKNKDTIRQALVHRSYINENKDFELDQNERLEFLGDAVLELIVTEFLYFTYENPEGELTNWRAALVNAKMLAAVAKEVQLEPFLYLSHGESKDTNQKARDYILANAFEAVIGAIYLDRGYDTAKDFIMRIIAPKLDHILEEGLYMDAKSRFQESAQEKAGVTPTYKVLEEEGPDHDKHFKIGVYLEKKLIAVGEGTSKQEAQTDAAEHGLKEKGWKGPEVEIKKLA